MTTTTDRVRAYPILWQMEHVGCGGWLINPDNEACDWGEETYERTAICDRCGREVALPRRFRRAAR